MKCHIILSVIVNVLNETHQITNDLTEFFVI